MEQDYLKELEFLGITARIKRLSDSLFYGIKELYASQNIDIEPGWHLVLLLLKNREKLYLHELAQALNISKPALTKMAKKMQLKGYVEMKEEPEDFRKKQVQLTELAKRMLPEFEKIWDAGQKAVQEILAGNPHFRDSLTEFENQQYTMSFSARAIKHLE